MRGSRFRSPRPSGIQFRPTILALRSERELRWLGRLFIPGLFDGEHYFLLEPLRDTRTRLTQGENFSGDKVTWIGRIKRRMNTLFSLPTV